MDLLFYLQNTRNVCPDWFNLALMMISESVIFLVPLSVICIYWTVDKKIGTYMLCTMLFALFFNELLKVTFCIYRPWILDSRITPAAEVLHTATNYSFPSSHSCTSAAAVAALICACPGKKRRNIIGCLFVLLVMISRMYLGCHTLPDVFCGAAVGTGVAFLFRPMLSETFRENSFSVILFPVSIVLTVLAIVYILNKSYPLDYGANGTLLVDPAHMCPDAIGICGCVIGIGLGLFLENRFIHFSMPGTRNKAIIRILCGAAVIGLLYFIFLKTLSTGMSRAVSKFCMFSVGTLFICAGYPALFSKLGVGRK